MRAELEEFLAAYDEHRVQDQVAFYKARMREYEKSARQIGVASQVLLLLAGVCGAVVAVSPDRGIWLGVAAAGLAAAAAVITSWSDAIGFAANAELYRSARAGLAHVRPRRPDPTTATTDDVKAYVADIEDILLGEVRSWSEKWGKPPLTGETPAAAG